MKKSAKQQITTISERTWMAGQSWHYERTVRQPADTLRVCIRRNAYDDQSSASVEKWTPSGWTQVVRWPITSCQCKRLSYVGEARASDFHNDAIALLAEASAVLAPLAQDGVR